MGGETSEMSSILDIVIFANLFVLCVVAVVLLRTLMSRRNPSGTSARVKRPFTLLLLILVISLSTFAYAATQVNVSNTGNITTGYNLLIASPSCAAGAFSSGGTGGNVCEFPSGTSCGPISGNYIDSALAINDWSLPQGGSYTIHVCLENSGTASHTLSIKGNAQPTGLIFSSDRDGQSVSAGAFMLVGMTFTASQTISTGNGLNFGDVTIQ